MEETKKMLISLLQEKEKVSITHAATQLGIGYYKFKFDFVPKLIQQGVIDVQQHKSFQYLVLK